LTLASIRPVAAQEKLLPVFHFQQVRDRSDEVLWSRVVRDSLGFVWIGTVNGLERFDGYGIKEYRNAEQDPYSLSSNIVQSLFCDSKNRLWIGTLYTGISLYNRFRDRFINFPLPDGYSVTGRTMRPRRFVEDSSGTIWFSSRGGIVRIDVPSLFGPSDFDSLARYVRFRAIPLAKPETEVYDLCVLKDGTFVAGTDSGLVILDPATLILSRPHFSNRVAHRLESLSIRSLVQEPDRTLWVATATEGLFRLDWEQGTATNYRHREGDRSSIRYDEILSIELDQRGNLWVGTMKGFDLFSPAEERCIPYLTYGSAPGTGLRQTISVDKTGTLWFISNNGVHWLSPRSLLLPHYSLKKPDGWLQSFTSVERDRNGTFWCFSGGKLLQMDLTTMKVSDAIDVFRGKMPDYSDVDDRTTSLLDRHGNLWHAAWGLGLYKINLSTKQVDNYSYRPFIGKSTSIRSIAQGPGDSLWTGTFNDGVFLFDPARATFSSSGMDSTGNVVTRVSDGTIWVATVGEGLLVHNPATGKTISFVHNPSDRHSLSDNLARLVYEDPSGRIWVGAGKGINLWDPGTSTFQLFPNPSFEKSLFVVPIGSDTKGRVWLRHISDYLSFFDPADSSFTNFGVANGLSGASADMQILDDGRILLTGTAGLNIFHPDSLRYTRQAPHLDITQFVVNDSLVISPQLAGGSGVPRLAHDQNVLELTFAAADIDAPDLVKYEYRLVGLENDWVKPKNRRYVRYTALAPGDYTFIVKASSSWREWPAQEISFAFSIAPPWWRTAWAYAIYILLITGLLFAAYRARLRQMRLKQDVEVEHFQAEHLAKVDQMKSRFFANISHEFRTPLTLILGPVETTLSTSLDAHVRETLILVKRNAQKLHTLVNQLLEFSRIESGNMKLSVSDADLVPFLQRAVQSFQSWAERKQIALKFVSEAESIPGLFDDDKLEKIINNLISNALKFTAEGGRVEVHVVLTPPLMQNSELRARKSEFRLHGTADRGVEQTEGRGVTISVSDTGPGISPDHLPHIFDRFYRIDESHRTEGTGIGLALTKELVDLHHGTIAVHSEVNKGSTFTVNIPLDRDSYGMEEISKTPSEPDEEPSSPPSEVFATVNGLASPDTRPNGEKPLVLVAEDNFDVRAYLRSHLEIDFAVREAENGRTALEKAIDVIPDLVVSDVMMPEMDGYELTRALKHDERTSHIPVILLTARAASESKIEGLETGADDYLTKPFDAKELLTRIRNLIEIRRQLRKKFSVGTVLKPGEVAVPSIDDALLKRIMEAVEREMGDEGFGVEQLARQVALGRRQLERKLLGLTNLSPAEFIRYMRLHRAHELLKKNVGSVAEIAFQVGFSSPSHFSSSFHQQFGFPPSEVQRQAM
jgi:signal transduction histidine kinase/DNA-binding response OmpR family regulator/ligand-binding sensor domain-containing protein